METTRFVEGIGPVTLRRSRHARRFAIRVTMLDGVQVTVPWSASYASALETVQRHRDWVLREMRKRKEREERQLGTFAEGGLVTRSHRLLAEPADVDKATLYVRSGVIAVKYPRTLPLDSPSVRRAIHAGMLAAYRIEAHQYLPGRVRELAARHGFLYRRLFIKNLRSRWGSCSAANNINLALQLMRLPDELVDYLILHELVHTKVKNHGPGFWKLLDEVSGDAKGLDRKLRKERLWE